MTSLFHQQRVVVGPLVFTSDFDGGNMGRVERLPLSPNADTKGSQLSARRCAGSQATFGEEVEYAVTVSPDCAGTPKENSYRTWFYFGVSLADPTEDACLRTAPPTKSPRTEAPAELTKSPRAQVSAQSTCPSPRETVNARSTVSFRSRRRRLADGTAGNSCTDENAEASASAEGETDQDFSGDEYLGRSGAVVAGPEDTSSGAQAEFPAPLPVTAVGVVSELPGPGLEISGGAKAELPIPDVEVLPEATASLPELSAGGGEVRIEGLEEAAEKKPEEGMTINLAVRNMNNQGKLYKQGYRPWVRVLPEEPRWHRLPDTREANFSFEWTGEPAEGGEGFIIRWRYHLERRNCTAFFSFCVPSGYDECQEMVSSIEAALCSGSPPAASGLAHTAAGALEPPLGCLSRAIQEDWVPRLGSGIYFHRQPLQRTLEGRMVELLTVTATPPGTANASGEGAEHQRASAEEHLLDLPPAELALDGNYPRLFPGRPLVFVSARVHPGETPAQFVFWGLFRFLLSDDPRAVELRNRFVFKLVPMLNPDGVARGHYRTNSQGLNLNRYYDNPTREEHEGVWAAKRVLLHWASEARLLLYLDLHGHATKKGCFLLANRLLGASQAWNLGYARLCQINSPHFDLDGCDFAENGAAEEKGKDGLGKQGSGRVSVYRDCHICHSYTLECNYNMGRFSKPVATAAGLPVWAECPGSCTRSSAAVLYTPGSWAQVGEALLVSLLDLYGHNCNSRLPGSKYGSVAKMISSCPCLRSGAGCRVVKDVTTEALGLASLEAVRERERDCRCNSCCWGAEERRRKVARGVYSARASGIAQAPPPADVVASTISTRRASGKAIRSAAAAEAPGRAVPVTTASAAAPGTPSSRPVSSSSQTRASGTQAHRAWRGRSSSTAAAAAASLTIAGPATHRMASNGPRRRATAGSDLAAGNIGGAEHRRSAQAAGAASKRSSSKRSSTDRRSEAAPKNGGRGRVR
mmetsp:Transcript_88758/g.153688  ORF Transcript_88758/g.153688 Transcript_88758/m.153688 type:complete len:978 (+) Transcript_88758:148-3081(+)